MDKFLKKKQIRVCAFILAVMFGVISVCSWAVVYLTKRSVIYSSDSLGEVLKENQEYLQTIYSYLLVYGVNNENSEQAINLKDSNLKYFVKKDGEEFLSNCDEEELAGAYEVTFDEGDLIYSGIDGYFGQNRDNLINVLTRDYDFFIGDNTGHQRRLEIKEIIFNKKDSRFYMNFGDLAIPMDKVRFSYAGYEGTDEWGDVIYSGNYSYDKDKKGYYIDENREIEEDTGKIRKQRQEKFEISKINDWESVYFYDFHEDDSYSELCCGIDDITVLSDLGALNGYVDGKAQITGIVGRNDEISDLDYNRNYNWNDCFVEVSSPDISPDRRKYSVLTKLKPYEDMDKYADDMFYQLQELMSYLYNMRYTNIAIAVCCWLLFLVMLYVYTWNIMVSGGREEKRKKGILSSCPFEIYLLVAGFAIILSVLSITDFIERITSVSNADITDIVQFCIFLTAFIFIVGVMTIGELCKRHRDKVLFKSTLTGMGVRFIKKEYAGAVTYIRENVNCFIRIGVFIIVIFFAELFVIMVTDDDVSLEIIIWLVCKIVEIPLLFKLSVDLRRLQDKARSICDGNVGEKIDTDRMWWELKRHGDYLNKIDEGVDIAVQKQMKSERMRTELITNVSHDIKTPLTSIINYVDLLGKEGVREEDRAQYIEVLNRKSAELKKLIEDLIEASKASTGNISVDLQKCDVGVLMVQVLGEFEEKLSGNDLELITRDNAGSVNIMADRRHLWRVFDNLMNNICKYSQPGTRVYVDVETGMENVYIIFRNMSKYPLNISSNELLERFVRGDSSRHTEGNGLGLAIALSLTELMKGKLNIFIDGDLFKVVLEFPFKGEIDVAMEKAEEQ